MRARGHLQLSVTAGLTTASLAALLLVVAGGDFAVSAGAELELTGSSAAVLFAVTALGLVVVAFTSRYCIDDPAPDRLLWLMVGTIVGAGFVAGAADLATLLAGWVATTIFLAALLLHRSDLGVVRASRRRTGVALAAADAMLLGAAAIVFAEAGNVRLGELGAVAERLADASVLGIDAATLTALLIVGAAVGRCAQIPFGTWLPTTLAAPTPVSALLHAGVVNGGALLLVGLAPLVFAQTAAVWALFSIASATMLWATSQMVARPDVKGGLMLSTRGQMAFMLLQCAIGAFASAIFHLIAHGMYKAYLFFASGGAIAEQRSLAAAPGSAIPPARGRRAVRQGVIALAVPAIALAALDCGARAFPARGLIGSRVAPLRLRHRRAAHLVVDALPRAAWPNALRKLAGAAARSRCLRRVTRAGEGTVRDRPRLLTGTRRRAVAGPGTGRVGDLGEMAGCRRSQPRRGSPANPAAPAPRLCDRPLTRHLGATTAAPLRAGRRGRSARTHELTAGSAMKTLIGKRAEERPDRGGPVQTTTRPDVEASLIRAEVGQAANVLFPLWPLESFIAVNPLGNLAGDPFESAGALAADALGARWLPDHSYLADARERGRITSEDIEAAILRAASEGRSVVAPRVDGNPAGRPAENSGAIADPVVHEVSKWCAAFLDTGQSTWPMPGRERGLYRAWRALVEVDPGSRRLGAGDIRELARALPDRPEAALADLLDALGVSREERPAALRRLLGRCPGWGSAIRWRNERTRDGHPADLIELAAIIAFYVRSLEGSISITDAVDAPGERIALLEAFEWHWRDRLISRLDTGGREGHRTRPDAQAVFCIDARSEGIRRHLEAAGNYETLGFAGFFGLAVSHRPLGAALGAAQCPVLVEPAAETTESPLPGSEAAAERWLAGRRSEAAAIEAFHRTKNDLSSKFALAELTGWFLGPWRRCGPSHRVWRRTGYGLRPRNRSSRGPVASRPRPRRRASSARTSSDSPGS